MLKRTEKGEEKEIVRTRETRRERRVERDDLPGSSVALFV